MWSGCDGSGGYNVYGWGGPSYLGNVSFKAKESSIIVEECGIEVSTYDDFGLPNDLFEIVWSALIAIPERLGGLYSLDKFLCV